VPIALQLLVALRPEDHEPFQRALLDAGLIDQLVAPRDPDTIVQQLDLPTEEVLFRLTTALRRHGVDRGQVRRFWRPTPKELNAAELLWMFPWIHASGRREPRPEREYDCSAACSVCGAGLRPLGPLRLRRGEVPRTGRLGSVSQDLLIIHDEVKQAWEAEGLRGPVFVRALDWEGGPLPWHEVRLEFELPPMLAGSTGLTRGRIAGERPCARCGRDGWFDDPEQPFEPLYERRVLDQAPDLGVTHEYFGTGELCQPLARSRLAGRRIIARARVYRLCRRLKLRGIRFSPVGLA
jgi:hypothetical protein